MANENTPLFSLPSLEQFQKAQKAADAEGMNLLQTRSLNSSYDLARQLGYKSADERKVEAANKVMADAQMGEDETDPLKRQFNVLGRAAQSFGKLGMYDVVQQIAPELARLKNQMLEQRKLTADANKTEVDTDNAKVELAYNLATLDARAEEQAAKTESAGLDEETWVNQSTGDIQSVNAKSRADTALWKAKGYTKYVPGIGADKEALKGKPKDDLVGDVIKADSLLMKLRENVSQYDPRYLTLGGRLESAFSNAKEMAGLDLSPEDQQFLANMSAWQRSSFEVMNQYIHDMTGAQMSQFETYRLVKGIPDPSRDGGTKYMGKLRDLVRATLQVKKYKGNLLATGKPQDMGWTNPNNLPYVTDKEVTEFLGTNLGVFDNSPKASGPATRTKTEVLDAVLNGKH